MIFANLSVCELKAGEGQKLVQQNNVTSTNTVLITQCQYSDPLSATLKLPAPIKAKSMTYDTAKRILAVRAFCYENRV